MNARLRDEKPLADVLQSLIKSSPNLVTLLQMGQRISAPFNTRPSGGGSGERFWGRSLPNLLQVQGYLSMVCQ